MQMEERVKVEEGRILIQINQALDIAVEEEKNQGEVDLDRTLILLRGLDQGQDLHLFL
jgi:hypothetical protein